LLLFFTVAIIGLNFSIPTITLVLLTLLNDGTVISIAYDNVIPSKKPEAWRLWVITGISIAVGSVATIGLFGIYYMYTLTNDKSHNYFQYKFSPQCYYSHGPFPGQNSTVMSDHPVCFSGCPGYEDVHKSCGDWVGWSEAITVVYLCLSIGGQLTVFVSRTKHSFWSRRPGHLLWISCLIAQIIATIMCVYWPVKLGITAYIGVPSNEPGSRTHPIQVAMKGVDWKMAGWIWLYSIGVFIIEDFVKVYCFYSFDNDDKPEVDLQEIKRQRKPFLPKVKDFFRRGKKRNDDGTLVDVDPKKKPKKTKKKLGKETK